MLDRSPSRSREDEASDREQTGGYKPPESPDEDHFVWLGLKVALAMLIANIVALRLGFDSPTWSVLTAAFLATSPPIASGKAAMKKIIALGVGIALGVAGALMADTMSSIAMLHIGLVGLVAGMLGSRSPDYLFAAVVGTVVTFVGSGGSDPTMEVAVRTVCMVLIGCAIGPMVVWVIERIRRQLHKSGIIGT